MKFVLHEAHGPLSDMEEMRALYENLVYSDFLLYQYREGNFTLDTLIDMIALPNIAITEEAIDQFSKNSIQVNNLFKNWFLQLGFFEDEKLYQRINSLDKIILSAKYGKPFAYRYESLVPIENLVLNSKRNFWQHFYGIVGLYHHKESLERRDHAKRKLVEKKRAEAKEIEPIHSYNKFIEFLCPELNGRILFWGEYNKALHNAEPEELATFFNWINFYREFISNSPKIDFENIAQHEKLVLALLKEYAQSYFSLLSSKHWKVILEFLRKYSSNERKIIEIAGVFQNETKNNEAVRDFERLAMFFDADKYMLYTTYNGHLSYDLSVVHRRTYEKWELENDNYLDYFAKVIALAEESRNTHKVINIKTLENTFSERLRHNFYPVSKSLVDEWIEKRLNYERYLNAEYIIKEISQFIFDNESFLKTHSDNI